MAKLPSAGDRLIAPVYGGYAATRDIPLDELPDHEMPRRVAFDLIRDALMLDGNARLNLATFVTTFMEDEACELMALAFDKNMIDKDEYPITSKIENRCVNMVARLWHSAEDGQRTGVSTVGSSEAAMLAGMAFKWNWKARQSAAGKPTDKPNMVMGINVQVCWEKFCRYWEVEPRFVPMDGDRFHISPAEAVKLCDENTIGVVGILGSTYDGSYEPIKDLCKALDAHETETGLDIPVHVDAASGGFIAPFLDEDLEWDFRLDRVHSINASGHKYGLVFPGVGWVVWRDRSVLPEDLVFYTNYLGGQEMTLALNFSRPGNQVIGQYYNFLRFGWPGYTAIQQACRYIATELSAKIEALPNFELITRGDELPVFAFKLKDEITDYTGFDVSARLRENGWQVPAYSFPKNREDLIAMRVVVKQGFTRDMADMLVADLEKYSLELDKSGSVTTRRGGFSH